MLPDWLLYLITDRHHVGARGLPEAVADAIRGGVRAVQLREKDLPVRSLIDLAQSLRALTAPAGARLLINGRLDVMLAVDADGIHLRSDSLPPRAVRGAIGPDKWLGVSTHSLQEVERAADEGADFVTFGPVYETSSKAKYGAPTGLQGLEAVCRHARVPVYALGGITRVRIPEVMAAGAHGVALIAEIMSSRDVSSAAGACLDAVRTVTNSRSVDPG
jgi:thiamine-phosphate pyrophosphorylase